MPHRVVETSFACRERLWIAVEHPFSPRARRLFFQYWSLWTFIIAVTSVSPAPQLGSPFLKRPFWEQMNFFLSPGQKHRGRFPACCLSTI